jgi:hypothetical protein
VGRRDAQRTSAQSDAEDRAQLLVRRERPRLREPYESWGYRHAGEQLPFPDSPLYDVMVLERPRA